MRRNIWLSAALVLFAAPASFASPEDPPATPPAAMSKDAAAAEYLKELQGKLGKQADQEAKDSIAFYLKGEDSGLQFKEELAKMLKL